MPVILAAGRFDQPGSGDDGGDGYD